MVACVRVFVIHTHPVEQSYNAAIRNRVVETLRDAGHVVDVSLLGDGTNQGPDDLIGYEALVLINPIWWGGMPAPLLAWVQRVLGPEIDGSPSRGRPSPLSSIAHLIAVVTHGSSRLINRLEGEPARQLLRRSVLPLCAGQASFDWVSLYKLDRRPRHELEEFIRRAADEVEAITTG